jgi:hypothetical protein
MRRRQFAAALLLALCSAEPLVLPRVSLAGDDRAMALDLFEQGRALFKNGNYAAALTQFEAAAKVMRTFGILLNIAECQEKLGRTASAWATWREARAVALEAQKTDDEAMAAERQRSLEPALSRLTIVVPPGMDLPELEVLRDGAIVPREAWGRPIAVDPGAHLIEARAPGRKARSFDVSVQGNADKRSVTLSPLETDGAPPATPTAAPPQQQQPVSVPPPSAPAPTTSEPPASPPPPAVDASNGSGSGQRLAGWVLAGLGVAGAGAGIAVALAGQGQHNDAVATDLAGNVTQAQGMESDANTTKTAGYVTIGVGGAFLVSGLVLVLTAPASAGASTSGRVSVSPWVSPVGGAGGAIVSRAW